jgi:hypothetical protein
MNLRDMQTSLAAVVKRQRVSRRKVPLTGGDAGMPRAQADAYLPLKALAAYSGLSVRTLRGYLVHPSRALPHFRVGGKILVKRSEFESWIAAFRGVEPPALHAILADVLKDL